jgi:hypothetical protein
VGSKDAQGFAVQADQDIAKLKGKKASDLAGSFSWRVVVKPKTDVKVDRLGKFIAPKVDPGATPNVRNDVPKQPSVPNATSAPPSPPKDGSKKV